MSGRTPQTRGFSLIEVMVAMGLLASLIVGVAASQGDAMYRAVEVMNLTRATQVIEGVVMNIEEEYRTDGFPTNQVEDRDCSDMLPRGFDVFDDDVKAHAEVLRAERVGNAYQRRSDVTTDRALEWLDTLGDEPFGLFVHYFDAHDPSLVPPRASK